MPKLHENVLSNFGKEIEDLCMANILIMSKGHYETDTFIHAPKYT